MKTVFVDVDTQLDFLYPAGALYVPGGERIVDAIACLNRYAAGRGMRVVSTADAHAENDPEFATWPPHCIAGTAGQHKAAATLLEKRVVIPNRDCAVAFDDAQQIIVRRCTLKLATPEINARNGVAIRSMAGEAVITVEPRAVLHVGRQIARLRWKYSPPQHTQNNCQQGG